MSDEKETVTPDAIAVPKETTAAMVMVSASGIAITNLEELMKFSRMLVADGAAPKKWSAGQVAIAIQSGLQVGLGLTGGIQQGLVINGIFSWRGQAAVALIQNSGKCKPGSLSFGCRGEGDARTGYAVAHRIGYARPEERTFSVDDARRAGLWTKEGPWHDYPERQLAWRAVGFLARDVFPDVLGGFPLAEEAVDFEVRTERKSGPRPELPPPSSPDPLMDAIEGKVPIEEKVLQSEIEKDRVRPEVGKQSVSGENMTRVIAKQDCWPDGMPKMTKEELEAASEDSGKTIDEVFAPKEEAEEAELVPEVPAPPTEAEQPSLIMDTPEDKCRHGLVPSVHCVDCDDEEAAIAAEKASS